MDEDKFMDWMMNNYDTLAVKFAESPEEEFEEYCFQQFIQRGNDRYEEEGF